MKLLRRWRSKNGERGGNQANPFGAAMAEFVEFQDVVGGCVEVVGVVEVEAIAGGK